MIKTFLQFIIIILFVFLLCNTFIWLKQVEEVAKSSPEQTKIVFSSERDGNEEIYVMNADGSEQKRLTNNPAVDGSSSWSPDGKKIAFESKRAGNLEIYVMNIDGSELKRLTRNRANDMLPSWSPFLKIGK